MSEVRQGYCNVCQRPRRVKYLILKQNISLFLSRWERSFSGHICFPCAVKTAIPYTLTTMFLTWFGMIGALLGPAYITNNLVELVMFSSKLLIYNHKRPSALSG